MATTNYNLPTIAGNMTADVVRDMNALAEATDGALKGLGDGKANSIDLTQLQSQVTTHLDDTNQRMINIKFPPAHLVAAVGDGIANDSPAIQSIIDYVSSIGGGTVFFPNGIYNIETTLRYKAKVSLKGVSGVFNSRLNWTSATQGYILDTTNIDLNSCSIENLCFTSATPKLGSGIIGGSTFLNYNAFNMRFRDLLFFNLGYGINGIGVLESTDSRAIGIFDSYFENVWCSDCTEGLLLGGSGNVLINPRLSGCHNSLVLGYASPDSISGVHVFGGVFASNKSYDIMVQDKRGLRNSTFVGTWFEDAVNGIINIPYTDTFVSSLIFIDCLMQSKAAQFGLFNVHNALGTIKLDNCVIAQTLANQDMTIVPPVNLTQGTTLKISNTLKIAHDNTRTSLNYSIYDSWNLLSLLNGWVQIANNTKFFKTDDNIVHLQFAMKDGTATAGTIIGNIPIGYRPKTSIRFSIFDATNRVERQMYVSSNGDIVVQEVTGTALATGIWAGYATFKVD